MARITVQNDKGKRRTFDLSVWNKMGNKYGWKPVADAPDEVKAMQQSSEKSQPSIALPSRSAGRNKTFANKPSVARSTKGNAPAPVEETVVTDRPNVQGTIKLLKGAKSIAEVDKIIKGDTRVSVIKAADHRKTELA